MFSLLQSLSGCQLLTLMAGAVLIGINKTAIPGLGVLPVVLLASTFETRMSTGLQLGMLALADIIAVVYYRRSADWKILWKLLIWALAGLAIGSLLLRYVIPPENDAVMKRVIGGTVLALFALSMIKKRISPDKIPGGWGWSAFFGILMGTTTQLANAAGPVSALYFLAMKLEKQHYMGTCAWCFLLLNWIKLPIFALEGRVTMESVKLDLCMLPLLIAGGALGILVLRKIPQKYFELVVQLLAVATSVKLVIS